MFWRTILFIQHCSHIRIDLKKIKKKNKDDEADKQTNGLLAENEIQIFVIEMYMYQFIRTFTAR